jgi:GAF domain-containing protein
MFKSIREFFATPNFEGNPQGTEAAITTHRVAIALMLIGLLGGLIAIRPGAGEIKNGIGAFGAIFVWIGCIVLNKRGKTLAANIIIIVMNLLTINGLVFIAGGLSSLIIFANILIAALAALLLPPRGIIGVALAALAIFSLLYFLNPEAAGSFTASTLFIIYGFTLVSTASILEIAAANMRRATERARASEEEVRQANTELQALSKSLEKIVAERTTELQQQSSELARQSVELEKANVYNARRVIQFQAISEVSRATSSIQELPQLLPRIAQLISTQFGFYHVGIFLADEAREYAVLTATNSEGGQRMLARGHRLRIGQVGIVGNVVGTGIPRIALDTGADAVFFQNLDLPDTHSEMALPLRAGSTIIGALDVQSTEPNAFGQDDIEVLATLAEQVSIALQNARQYEETQRALAEAEAIYRQSLRREWQHLSKESQAAGFRYSILGTQVLHDTLQTEEIQKAIATGELQAHKDEEGATMAVPIKLRGEVIGVLNVRAPGGHVWNQNEVDVVQAVADRVALSAENARLFEETTSRAERERTVADITNKIRSTNDPQEMVNTALAELKRALNASLIQIMPYNTQDKSGM